MTDDTPRLAQTISLREAEAAFDFIRGKLIKNLEEPERSAFWKAVEMRGRMRAALAPGNGAVEADKIEWTEKLEKARLDLCHFWLEIADDHHEGKTRFPELGRRAIETEQALTILGEIARQAAPSPAALDPVTVERCAKILECAFNECTTLNLLNGAARLRALIGTPASNGEAD
jgi:hypothetical protein